jgi:hypothetical protein
MLTGSLFLVAALTPLCCHVHTHTLPLLFRTCDPLVQTHVLPYLRQLAAAGMKVHLLTFGLKVVPMRDRDDA